MLDVLEIEIIMSKHQKLEFFKAFLKCYMNQYHSLNLDYNDFI